MERSQRDEQTRRTSAIKAKPHRDLVTDLISRQPTRMNRNQIRSLGLFYQPTEHRRLPRARVARHQSGARIGMRVIQPSGQIRQHRPPASEVAAFSQLARQHSPRTRLEMLSQLDTAPRIHRSQPLYALAEAVDQRRNDEAEADERQGQHKYNGRHATAREQPDQDTNPCDRPREQIDQPPMPPHHTILCGTARSDNAESAIRSTAP
ncbi:hypothetical protein [Phytohabitans suffuscus]|uniref:Uncharacterized protein n=1 Tax=Phytohabitans suffuscus TaxID=624315 RepID=A0A6F8YCK7_9ACTN|nr:hypothetical protein [Phytohabitans suffuscus]BCB83708.1 hypothetical protein Psuf_010210 [Phytohabitans suffuscus]